MKVSKKIFIIFSMILLLIPDISLGKDIRLELERPVIPVLVKKQINPTIKATLIQTDNSPYTIRQIDVDLQGSTDLSDIVSVAVYGTHKNGLIDESRLICRPVPAERKISFTDNIQVKDDSLSFWVAVTLRDTVSLTHRISVNCSRIKTSRGELKVSNKDVVPLRVGMALRQKGQDGIVSSRIPGLATSNNGTLLAIFDARYDLTRDLQGNIDIALHRSFDKGLTWQPIQTVLDMGEWGGLPQKFNGVSDACILVDKNTNDIYIAGLWMHGALDDNGKWIEGLNENSTYWIHQWRKKGSQPGIGLKETCQFLITKSTDDGLTWSFPDNITGKTKRPEWWLFAPAPGQGITLADGTLMLNMRDNRNRGNKEVNGRRICTTTDLGETWTEHSTSRKALVEPTCMASLHRHDYTVGGEKRSILLFANPSDYETRDKLTLKVSFDDGMTWPEKYWILFDQYRSAGYSSITSIDENSIGILYESSQANMAFIKIDLTEILNR